MRLFLALCFALLSLLPARADTFAFNAVLSSGTINGTVDIDTVQGLYTGANFTINLDSDSFYFKSVPTDQNTFVGLVTFPRFYYGTFQDDFGNSFFLALQRPGLVGFQGGTPFCGDDFYCLYLAGGHFDSPRNFKSYALLTTSSGPVGDSVLHGTFDPVAATPEPSTCWLVATGLVGLGLLGRKRCSSASPMKRLVV